MDDEIDLSIVVVIDSRRKNVKNELLSIEKEARHGLHKLDTREEFKCSNRTGSRTIENNNNSLRMVRMARPESSSKWSSGR